MSLSAPRTSAQREDFPPVPISAPQPTDIPTALHPGTSKLPIFSSLSAAGEAFFPTIPPTPWPPFLSNPDSSVLVSATSSGFGQS